MDMQLTTDEQRLVAEELSGCPAPQLLKVRATADSLVVVIHTGQKFIYDLAAIQAAIERLAAGAGRFARETFLAELEAEAQALLAAREAELAAPAEPRARPRAGAKSARSDRR